MRPREADFTQSPRHVVRAVGLRLRSWRIAAGLSQDVLAERSGVSRDTVTRIERGENIGFEPLVRIAIALDAAREFDDIFPAREMRSLDEILAAQRKPQRARRRPVP